jgi:hypothetical protein
MRKEHHRHSIGINENEINNKTRHNPKQNFFSFFPPAKYGPSKTLAISFKYLDS